jgi:hypothetical protein
VKRQHTGARLAIHLNEGHECFEHTAGRSCGVATNNTSSTYSMTEELQSTVEATGIERPALRNQIPNMAPVIQLTIGAFMSSLGVKGLTKSWKAHQRNQPFGVNASTDIGKSQRLLKVGNA